MGALLYVGKVSDYPKWNFPSHKHDELHEIVYIIEGEGQFVIGGRPYEASKGDILIYNKGVIHEERSSLTHPIATYFCGLSASSNRGNSKEWIIPPDIDPVIRANKYSHEVESLMSLLFEESSLRDQDYSIICESLLVSILTLIQRMISNQNILHEEEGNSLAVQIKHYIDKNYTSNVNLKNIADHFHISPYHLSHVFKSKYNNSPINYLILRRIGEAQQLLLKTEMKVWEIAKLTGYENANYFSMLFAKVTGESPKQFKKIYKKDLYSAEENG